MAYIRRVRRTLTAAVLIACLSLPLHAQDADTQDGDATGDMAEGRSLVERGVELFLRGLLSEVRPKLDEMSGAMAEAARQLGPALQQLQALIDDVGNYEAPKRLPNGDIVIPRKPGAPPPPALSPPAPDPGAPEIEL